MQSLSNKVLGWALFMKQNLTLGPVGLFKVHEFIVPLHKQFVLQ